MICEIVGSTREQNGHWKSLIATIVTSASAGPFTGSADVTGTLKRSMSSLASPAPVVSESPSLAAVASSPPPEPDAVMLPITIPQKNANNIDTRADPLLMARISEGQLRLHPL